MAVAKTLQELLVMKLQALYDVESKLIRALPKMAKKAVNPELKAGFERHTAQTKEHAARLEQSLQEFSGKKARKLRGDAIRGIIGDATWVMETVKSGEGLDAGLIAAARYVEHYEIAGYDTALAWATLLDHQEVAGRLRQTLEEERAAERELNDLAVSQVNERAMPRREI